MILNITENLNKAKNLFIEHGQVLQDITYSIKLITQHDITRLVMFNVLGYHHAQNEKVGGSQIPTP